MSYHNKVTAEQIRAKLEQRIAENTAELNALKGVKIDTKHKTLTNRCISGAGARIDNYLGINKALYVSYVVETGTSRKYMSRDITAYSYTDTNGNELGVEHGFMRISRTITPTELAVVVQDIITGLETAIKKLKSEHKRAETIAKQRNALIDKINKFNEGVSYASEAQI